VQAHELLKGDPVAAHDARDELGIVRQGALCATRSVVRHGHWMLAGSPAFPVRRFYSVGSKTRKAVIDDSVQTW
jgi:hypothetical protein